MKILGVDFGDSRTGYAVSDPLGFGATTLDACKEKNMVKVADKTADLAKELGAELIILGFPKNMNGTIGPRGEKTQAFAK
ncbi:MAG: Holliday junction resolvase RuvX, partial [Clostridia bacterium]|nr:Holliday junction resolvase RuvX [Clostridia bacterium]